MIIRGLAQLGRREFFHHFSILFATSFRTSVFIEFYCILAVNMGPTWPHLRIPERFKMASKIDADFVAFLEALGIDFGTILGGKLEVFGIHIVQKFDRIFKTS